MAVIKLMSSPVVQLNKEIALPDILRIPKYDNPAISSGKMDLREVSFLAGGEVLESKTICDKCFGVFSFG